jgi:hypothetical protein
MSNIFYTEVDKNLQIELDARGRSGFFNRSTRALDFMLGKIANVQLTAYEGNDSKSPLARQYAILGGANVQTGGFLPNGPNGFLSDRQYTQDSINFYTEQDVTADPNNKDVIVGNAYTNSQLLIDKSRRIGPHVVDVSVDIGDHSMGLLNKASVKLMVPNPGRDLDGMEETWLRPGRYVKIEIVHPKSALVSAQQTDGLLSEKALPNRERIKELYPNWDVDEFLDNIAQMNVFTFEGLITSFDLSYTTDATVDISLSLTGTSNTYTDVSMYLTTPKTAQENPKKDPKIITNPVLGPTIKTEITTDATGKQITTQSFAQRSEFYDQLYNQVDKLTFDFCYAITEDLLGAFQIIDSTQLLIPFSIPNAAINGNTDHFILTGQQWLPKLQESEIAEITGSFKADPNSPLTIEVQQEKFNADLAEKQKKRRDLIDNFNSQLNNNNQSDYNRYITLGGLIHFINTYNIAKITGSAKGAEIVCSDALCFSNFYPSLVSTIPDEVLFLPENPDQPYGMNYYDTQVHYYNRATIDINNIVPSQQTLEGIGWRPWPGVHLGTDISGILYPSRIFLNLEMIERILNNLSSGNTAAFSVKTFLSTISSKISYATGKAIDLKLVSYPDDPNKLIFTDTKYLKSTDKLGSVERIKPYSVPMFANHPNGSIVREFSFSAKLPNSVKNLSYVLNQGDEVTEESIAPYMNFMYNAKDPKKINEILQNYRNRHAQIVKQLAETKLKYAASPGIPSNQQALFKAITDYIKFPTDDIKKSQQIAAPIFPFDVEITIDGINGLKYGDVLIFEALPTKYRVNTVFSIIGITHTVSNSGEWTSRLRCIMRPSID